MDIETLIDDYGSYIYNFALRLSCHPHTAEDLAQETFIKAWEHLSSLENPHSIKAWLRKICLNQFLMKNRKDKDELSLSSDNLSSLEQDGHLSQNLAPSPEEEAIVDETIRDLQNGCFLAMVRRLTLHQRIAFSLVDMFGLSIKEAADLIGVSEKATKGLLYRARMNLDDFFHDHCNLISAKNPCSCSAWIKFSNMRENHQKAVQGIKLIENLDYTQSRYTFDPRVRSKIHYLYAHMPDKKPPEDWYQNVILLLQTRTVPEKVAAPNLLSKAAPSEKMPPIIAHTMEYSGPLVDSSLQLQPYTNAYYSNYKKIYNDCFREMRTALKLSPIDCCTAQETLLQNHAHIFLLIEEGILKGAVSIYGSEIDDLIVAKSYQRNGYGKLLLNFAIHYLQHNHTSPILLHVADWNKVAMSLYQRSGFHITQTETIRK